MKALYLLIIIAMATMAAETLVCQPEKEGPGFEKTSTIKPGDEYILTYDKSRAFFGERAYKFNGQYPCREGGGILTYLGHDSKITFDYMQVEPVDCADKQTIKTVMIFNIDSKPVWFSCKVPAKEHLSALNTQIQE